MQFVNSSGKPLDIKAMQDAARRKARPQSSEAYHKGWLASGFPPQRLIDAKIEHERKVSDAAAVGRRMLPWDEGRYMRDSKPTKVRSRPYDTLAAAMEACALAERTGWRGCSWLEISKG